MFQRVLALSTEDGRTLDRHSRRIATRGGRVVLAGQTQSMQAIFQWSKMLGGIPHYETAEKAVASFTEQKESIA